MIIEEDNESRWMMKRNILSYYQLNLTLLQFWYVGKYMRSWIRCKIQNMVE